ncbi:F0F1 ATP synthase subunit delta [Pseudomonadales bacterium]|nr:F0F1 ATP synthase subunit delta [Pseudomonadales bacterium]
MAEAENTTIARPYARAAFSQALDDTSGLTSWSGMLGLLSAAVSQQAVRQALENPRLTTAQKASLLLDLVGDELSDKGKNFVSVLAEYGRIALLPTIRELFEMMKAHHEKTMEVNLTSAFEVSEQDTEKLSAALKKRLQRDIHFSSTVDSSLLGGVIIRTEDTVIDNSVRGKLQKLAQALS